MDLKSDSMEMKLFFKCYFPPTIWVFTSLTSHIFGVATPCTSRGEVTDI